MNALNTAGANLANKLFAIETSLQGLKRRVAADSEAQKIVAEMQISINEAKVLIVDLMEAEYTRAGLKLPPANVPESFEGDSS
jgi:hypothetical protein